jgi:hypothetical protein
MTALKSKIQFWLPHMIVIAWLFYLGITIWQHAALSQEPPVYDGLGYFLKGKNFWDLIWQNYIFNPFVWPSYRPPGTILMSFPFGFDGVQPFHFRSVFFAIVISAIAAWISLNENSENIKSRVISIALIFALTSLPMFYELDGNSDLPSYFTWGHVDLFFSSLAALTAVASLRSLHERSIRWLIFCVITASFSLWVKPAGLVIMGLVSGIWFVAAGLRIFVAGTDHEARYMEKRYFLRGSAITISIYAITVLAAVFGYLTAETFSFFRTALKFMDTLSAPWSMQSVQSVFAALIGYPFGVICVVGIVGAVVFSTREKRQNAWLNDPAIVGIISGFLYLIIGLIWWIITAEGTVIRYLFPFFLMFAVTLLPSIRIAATRFSKIIYIFIILICFCSSANIAALLFTEKPSILWQKVTGVNLSAGIWNSEVRAARQFISTKTRERNPTVIYTVDPYPGAYIFESEITLAMVMNPDVFKVKFLRPIDWMRASAYRFNDLVNADYLLVAPVRGVPLPDGGKPLNSFFSEEQVMRIWVSTLSENDGISIELNLPNTLLLKVTDHSLLSKAATRLTKKFSWRSETVAANMFDENQPEWWSAQTLSASAKKIAAEEIGFDNIYKLHALSITRIGKDVKIEAWWEELRHDVKNDHRYLFLHLVDATGKILHDQQISLFPYQPPNNDRRWNYASVIFNAVSPDAESLGFGVYQPKNNFLMADKGTRDWNNRRVIVPLP